MVKHVILWQLKDELSADEKKRVKADIKAGLEGVVRPNTKTRVCIDYTER